MRTFPLVIVGVAMDELRTTILARTVDLARVCRTKRVMLVHVLPENRPDLVRACESQMSDIREAAAAQFGSGVEVEARVVTGRPGFRLLELASEEKADLLCLGRSVDRTGSRLGTEARDVVRKAPCSVMLVSGSDTGRWRLWFVPIGFDRRSAEALELCANLAQLEESPTIVAEHVCEVPLGYHKVGQTWSAAADRQRDLARSEWEQLQKRVNLEGIDVQFRIDLDPDSHLDGRHPSRLVLAAIQDERPDIVLLGSQRKTKGAAFLLGSMASRVVEESDRTLLVLRLPGDNQGLLGAIFSM